MLSFQPKNQYFSSSRSAPGRAVSASNSASVPAAVVGTLNRSPPPVNRHTGRPARSGTMAISETTLKDTMEMLVAQQNEKGGVLGCELEAVVVDPASDWPLFAEKARELLEKDKVDVVFGCWTSVSRKSVLPVFEELERIGAAEIHGDGLRMIPVDQSETEARSKKAAETISRAESQLATLLRADLSARQIPDPPGAFRSS